MTEIENEAARWDVQIADLESRITEQKRREAAGAWFIDEDEQGGAGIRSSLPARGSEGR